MFYRVSFKSLSRDRLEYKISGFCAKSGVEKALGTAKKDGVFWSCFKGSKLVGKVSSLLEAKTLLDPKDNLIF